MIAGVVVSAISGGVMAVVFSLGADQGLTHAVMSYAFGGMLAVMSFLAISLTWRGFAAPSRF